MAMVTQLVRSPTALLAFTTTHTTLRSAMFHATHPAAWSHRSHAFSMAHHARSMLACEAAFILDDAPNFFVRQLTAKSNHAGTDRSVLDHPEDFAFCAMAPESMMLEIARRWVQLSRHRPIAVPIFSMTIEASPLTVIELFALLDDLRGTRQRTRECARFGQLVGRHHAAASSVAPRPRRKSREKPARPSARSILITLLLFRGSPGTSRLSRQSRRCRRARRPNSRSKPG